MDCPFKAGDILTCNDISQLKPTLLTIGKAYTCLGALDGSNCILLVSNDSGKVAVCWDRFTKV